MNRECAPRSTILLEALVLELGPDILNRAAESPVLESKGNGDENEVEDKHGYSKCFVHFPSGACNAENDKAQHAEKDENGTSHS